MPTKHSAVARAAMRSTIYHSCIPLAGACANGNAANLWYRTSHSAAPSSQQMPFRLRCSAR
eukprot:6157320-Prymnesium_polylepis.1